MSKSIQLRWFFVLSILFTVIIVPFLLFEEQITAQIAGLLSVDVPTELLALSIVGLLGLDVLLPIPSSLVSTTAGVLLGFLPGVIVCWTGMCAGCLLGYWIGLTGGAGFVRRLLGDRELERAAGLGQNLGTGAIVLSRAVPVVAEASTIAAGAVRFPIPKFLIVTGLANLGISVVYAGIGAYAFSANSFLLAFAGAVAVPGTSLLMYRLLRGLRDRPFSQLNVAQQVQPTTVAEEISFAATFNYPVHFTANALDPCNEVFLRSIIRFEPDKRHKLIVFADQNFVDARPKFRAEMQRYVDCHNSHLELVGKVLTVEGGEECKNNSALLDEIYNRLAQSQIDRHSFVVCFGGGSVLDLVGYAAATTHRGVRLVRFPTTVLAQNDAGIGVKNGINKFSLKNFVGSFQPPFAVINDSEFLGTLGERDKRAGLAEAIKVALIRDKAFFEFLEDQSLQLSMFEPGSTRIMIERCAQLHLKQIADGGDPFEAGSVRPLDFGHWAAHKLETLSAFSLRHGEAVAIGIALDSRYSVLTGLMEKGQDVRICNLLHKFGFDLWHPTLEKSDQNGQPAVLSGLKEFQEHLGGDLTITLLSEIGVGIEVHEIDHALMQEAAGWLHAREGAP